jgi:hypothetical protein
VSKKDKFEIDRLDGKGPSGVRIKAESTPTLSVNTAYLAFNGDEAADRATDEYLEKFPELRGVTIEAIDDFLVAVDSEGFKPRYPNPWSPENDEEQAVEGDQLRLQESKDLPGRE